VCGIAAIFNYRTGEPIDRGELNRIREAMTARGPDDAGDWLSVDGRVGLAHRRLSIIDLSPTGAQPMRNADATLVITFNGEIYNYRELRSELEARGFRFQGTSDTEVLVHLYEAEGEAMVNKLRGMYAFVLWDARKRGLFLARDPFGIKPLYYFDDGQTLRAASQVKALLAGGHIDTAPEPAGHVGFFLWGYVPCPCTLYRGIKGLPAGATLWVDETGNKHERTFCSISRILAEAESAHTPRSHTPRSTLHALRPALLDSVRHHLIADVPVGVFLSSGLDSTTVAALAAEHGSTLRTVTLGFEEFKGTANDETALAETVARQLGHPPGFPGAPPAPVRLDGPALHRWRQHLLRQPGRRAHLAQSRALGSGRGRAVRRLPELSGDPSGRALIKSFCRPSHAAIQPRLSCRLGPAAQALYLAEICRAP
jgi:asparagine synthase (glutamine-hydrolysing)